MKLLITYNFESFEKDIQSPNFYRSCVEKIFPEFSVSYSYTPDFKKYYFYSLLKKFKVGDSLSLNLCLFFWLLLNGHKYEVIVGWLDAGLVSSFVKLLAFWQKARVYLILYRIPSGDDKGISSKLKLWILRCVSSKANKIMALDKKQAKTFGIALNRHDGSVSALRYGVDFDWYQAHRRARETAVQPATLFCPGGAYRDDTTLERAVSGLSVTVKRHRLTENRIVSQKKHQIGRATILRNFNVPYSQYMNDCQNSAIAVIAVQNSDKPVGLTSLLECTALGRPVIITRGASSRDYVIDGKTGLLYEEGNWMELRKCIEYLLHNPEKAELMAQRALKWMSEEYSLHQCATDFFQKLAS